MKTSRICLVGALLSLIPLGVAQQAPTRTVQRITTEKSGDEIAAAFIAGDIGVTKPRGSAVYSNGTYRLASTGGDVWSRTDSFHFTSMLLEGDAQLIARVVSIDNTAPWAKAGLMLRDGDAPDARHASIMLTPERGFSFHVRNAAKERTTESLPKPMGSPASRDGGTGWIKIVREGSRISGYSSLDGTNWAWEGTYTFSNLPPQMLAGLAVSGQDAARSCRAVFEEVKVSPVASVASPATAFVGTGEGLRAQYFKNLDLTGSNTVRIDEILNFEWRKNAPVEGISRDRFSVRWEGEIQAQFSEPYAFHIIADDRARLWINGRLVIDDFIPHATLESAARIDMAAGQRYLVRVEYFQHGQDAVAKLLWSSPSTPKQIIPKSQLYPTTVDSDGDGMPDLWEIDHGLRANDAADAGADTDDDGLTNVQEYHGGKNPTVADSYVAGLPEPWRGRDIGSPVVKGYASHHKGTIAITSAGSDIWGNLDNFHFVYQPFKGDGEIVARVVSLQNTDPWAKACVMVRGGLTEESPHAMLAFTPERGLSFQHRSVTSGNTFEESGGPATPPRWIKIVRRGDRLSGYSSHDGQSWEWVSSERISLPEEAFVGIGASSHVPGLPTVAVFDNVSLRPVAPEENVGPFAATGDGLSATYYDAFAKATSSRVDATVNFQWGTNSPATNIGKHFFSVRWEGMVEAQFSETYAFHLITDDGVRLWVNGRQVIDAWSDRAATKMTARVPLRAGHKYLIKMEYYERTGEAVARLHWSSPSTPRQAIPQSQLYSLQHPDYGKTEDKDRDGMPTEWERIYALDDTDANDASADRDQDGLTNLEEYRAGTHPAKADTDGDGIPDLWEVRHALSATDARDAAEDSDQDGLSDLEEYRAGTDPNVADSDGDGLNDRIEVFETGTNPTRNDISEITTVDARIGADASNVLGRWARRGEVISAVDRRGALEYMLNAPDAGMYRIEIEGGSSKTNDVNKVFRLLVWVDGEYIGRCHLVCGEQTNGAAHILTPWLGPGEHVVRLFWDNAAKKRSLQVDRVRLQVLKGNDHNGNGISDWSDNRVRALSGIDIAGARISSGVPIYSLVSPACIEGPGSYLSMMDLPGGITPKLAAGNRWYANVPLSTEGRSLVVSFQNGGLTQTNPIVWRPTNLRDAGAVKIRQGDALLFTMRDSAQDDSQVSIGVGGITNFVGRGSNSFPYRFTTAGTYQITGTRVPDGGTPEINYVTVQVIAATLESRPAAWAERSRLWTATNLPPGVMLDADPRIALQAIQETDTNRLYGLTLKDEERHGLVARTEPGGSILDRTVADGFNLYSSTDTGLEVIQTFDDGSQLIEMTLVSTPVLRQIRVQVDLVVGGVIFEDGTISKSIEAADFNAIGEARVRFIRPASAETSVCHTTRVYQGNSFLGIHR